MAENAKCHILDTFAAMISGSDLAPARAAYAFAKVFAHDSNATIAASTVTMDPIPPWLRRYPRRRRRRRAIRHRWRPFSPRGHPWL